MTPRPQLLALSLSLAMACCNVALAAGASDDSDAVINDSWYTMQNGGKPLGYYHEVIERRGGRYSYRYALKRAESGSLYEENIGALAQSDLKPIAFNLNKSSGTTTESTNATYTASDSGGVFNIEVSGSRAASFKRPCPSDAVLDVFFPIYLSQRWSQLKAGKTESFQTFSEDPEGSDFHTRAARYVLKSKDAARGCSNIHVELGLVRADWCLKPDGVLVDMKVGTIEVKRVKSETEAKGFVARYFPKEKSN